MKICRKFMEYRFRALKVGLEGDIERYENLSSKYKEEKNIVLQLLYCELAEAMRQEICNLSWLIYGKYDIE